MGNKMVKGYTKGVNDQGSICEKLQELLQRHDYKNEERRDWNVYRLMVRRGGHLVVLIPAQDKSVAISFGLAFTNDGREVLPNFEVSRVISGRPLIDGIAKFEKVGRAEEIDLSDITNCYLDQLQLFGDFHKRNNNCVHFSKKFTEALIKAKPKYDGPSWQCEAAMARIC